MRARRWARVGVEKCVSFSMRSLLLRRRGGLEDTAIDTIFKVEKDSSTVARRIPETGCDASINLSVKTETCMTYIRQIAF